MAHYTPLCSADTPTEAEKAQTLLTKASRDAALVNAGIISPEEARGALIADKESGYGDISAEAPEMGDLAQLQGLLGPEGGQDAYAKYTVKSSEQNGQRIYSVELESLEKYKV